MKFHSLFTPFSIYYLKLIYTELADGDKEINIRLELREPLRPDRCDGFRQGGRASAYDIAPAGGWPIPLEQISIRVHLWHDGDDQGGADGPLHGGEVTWEDGGGLGTMYQGALTRGRRSTEGGTQWPHQP